MVHDKKSAKVIAKMFSSIEQGDMETFRTCFEAGAIIWHNFDQAEQTVEQTADILQYFCSSTVSRKYQQQRISWADDAAFSQHFLTAKFPSGYEMRLPALMRIVIGANGLVSRIDEYFDPKDSVVPEVEQSDLVASN
ncbi:MULTISPECIES: nuclear transport factor 2 family protein [Sphingomonadales]|nr:MULTISPECIES: hypothetical protein [Sphingomonadaceae]MBT2245953.1 hypothetical protein [Sphingobium sp. BHU LFT2]